MPPEAMSRGRLEGKVALITGAARGQGRSHALGAAREGADVILLDAVHAVDTVAYAMPTEEDLDAVAKKVDALGRRAFVIRADVRDLDAMVSGVTEAVQELGRLDVVVANAGVLGALGMTWELSSDEWNAVVDVNMNGVWHTIKASIPHMIAAGNGGSVILISSIAGLRGVPGVSHYVTAKHALVGMAGSLANEVAEHAIRVNTVHPTNVDTPMINNSHSARIFRPDLEDPTLEDGVEVLSRINLLGVPWVEAEDVTGAVLWLASDEARFVTGATIPVDAGMLSKYHG